jgi:glycosyltransferase involved in cell wall biosynthesis
MNHPRVSVVMAVKNAMPYLPEALDSIAAQTRPAGEVVLVDGGSTDGTVECASRYRGVRCIPETGTGFAGAWNDGIDATTGDLVAFLDSDDRWPADKLARQVDRLMARPASGATIGRVKFFMAPGQRRPPGFKLELLDGDHVAHIPGSLVAHRSTFDRIGKFRIEWKIAGDVDWFARLKDSDVTLDIGPDVVLFKRVHDANLSYLTARTTLINEELVRLLRQSIHRQRKGRGDRGP